MTSHDALELVQNSYPGADAEWLYEDYRYYWRAFELEQDNGNISPYEDMLTFEQWLPTQPSEYLAWHGVTL